MNKKDKLYEQIIKDMGSTTWSAAKWKSANGPPTDSSIIKAKKIMADPNFDVADFLAKIIAQKLEDDPHSYFDQKILDKYDL